MGYRRGKNCIIPNGFDTKLFSPSEKNRRSVRLELNIPEGVILIGLIGRFDPLKDHCCFLKAGARLLSNKREVYFLLAGLKVDWQNWHLKQFIEKLGISGKVFLLGERRDVHRITAALDIAACSSISEGFPNVIGEAMLKLAKDPGLRLQMGQNGRKKVLREFGDKIVIKKTMEIYKKVGSQFF